jgi:hypothetical protein
MKKTMIVLLGSLFASTFALAATDYTLATSANLIGNYTVRDTGDALFTDRSYVDERLNQTTTTNKVLYNTYETFTATGASQWIEQYEVTQIISYDLNYTVNEYTQRNLSFNAVATVSGDQWVDLNFSTSSRVSYGAFALGTYGSLTSSLGFVEEITPAVYFAADGDLRSMGPSQSASPSKTGSTQWYAQAYGSINNSLRLVGDATDGGTVSFINVTLTGPTTYGQTVTTEHFSYKGNASYEERLIAAPVPEPETYAMLLAGLGLMGAVARRRRNATK